MAEAEGWLDVANCVTFTIQGPKGSCDAKLYCWSPTGDRIPSTDYQSSKRQCYVDLLIKEETGLTNESALLIQEPEVPETSNEAEAVLAETQVDEPYAGIDEGGEPEVEPEPEKPQTEVEQVIQASQRD
jgi:hypothetical protein